LTRRAEALAALALCLAAATAARAQAPTDQLQQDQQQAQAPQPAPPPAAPLPGFTDQTNNLLTPPQNETAEPTPQAPIVSPVGATAGIAPILPPAENANLSRVTELGVLLGAGETDNVGLTSTNQQSQTIGLAGVDFDLKRAGPRLDANLVGDFDYLDYFQNAYGGQAIGRFDGLVDAKLLPGTLTWVAEDDFGETQQNPLVPVVGTNLENINVFSTGPNLVLRPLNDTLFELGGRYALSDFEDSPDNGYRFLETATLERELSPASDVSLNANITQAHFDTTDVPCSEEETVALPSERVRCAGDVLVNTDFERRNFYGSYNIVGVRTQISAQLGVSQVNEPGYWISTPLAQLTLTRQISPRMSVNLSAGRVFTDALDSFRNLRAGAAGGIVIAPTTSISTGNYLSNYGSAGWSLDLHRTTFSLSARYERDSYVEHNQFDVRLASVQARAARALTSTLTAQLVASVTQTQYAQTPALVLPAGTLSEASRSDFGSVGGLLTWRLGRHVDTQLSYAHNFAGGHDAYTYSENRIFLIVAYHPPLNF